MTPFAMQSGLRGKVRCSRLIFALMLLLPYARLLPAQESIQSIGARAEQLETEGRWNEAAEAYRQILAIDPKSIAALNRLGALYVRQNQFAEGKKFYREALQVDPQNFGTNLNLGIALA